MERKSILIKYDKSKPPTVTKDFLVVVFEKGIPMFFGVHSGRFRKTGMVIYRKLDSMEDFLYEKLYTSGWKIDDEIKTRKVISDYIEQLSVFRVENVVEIIASNNDAGFELVKISDFPKREVLNLP